jgi:DHA1 family bicyclomycin/chloramphenicol resistance-like MFS transporter
MRIPFWLPLLLGFLTAVGPASTDMCLPAFQAIEASFHAPAGSAQYSLAAWFAGLAASALYTPPEPREIGRRVEIGVKSPLCSWRRTRRSRAWRE